MSEDGAEIKGLIVIVIAVVLLVGLVAIVSAETEPRLVPTNVADVEILRPISNVPPQGSDYWIDWGVYGCPKSNHAQCVDEASPDENTTYLWRNTENGSAIEDQHILSNLTRTDITITGVIAWSVARINATWVEGNAYSFGLSYPHVAGYGDCAPFWTGELSLAWTNYSVVVPSCCGAWTPLFINNMTFSQKGFGTPSYDMAVTSEGVTVSYYSVESLPETGLVVDLTLLLPFIIIIAVVIVVISWALIHGDES